MSKYASVLELIGNTPVVRLSRLFPDHDVWLKLERANPGGSVKDRIALQMVLDAVARGDLKKGGTIIEPTSGNTGVGLAMVSAVLGFRMILVMPESMSVERRLLAQAYGAELILSPAEKGMEGARDLANAMAQHGEGWQLDQFNNPDNPLAHYRTTGPEIWAQTAGRVTHFVSAMGTTGTITGTSRFLKEKNPNVRVVGLQPAEGSRIPGIRRWPAEYRPGIYRPELVDETLDILQKDAEDTVRALARREGICCGISSGGAVSGALRVAAANPGAVIVTIICDRGDRYLSTGIFNQ